MDGRPRVPATRRGTRNDPFHLIGRNGPLRRGRLRCTQLRLGRHRYRRLRRGNCRWKRLRRRRHGRGCPRRTQLRCGRPRLGHHRRRRFRRGVCWRTRLLRRRPRLGRHRRTGLRRGSRRKAGFRYAHAPDRMVQRAGFPNRFGAGAGDHALLRTRPRTRIGGVPHGLAPPRSSSALPTLAPVPARPLAGFPIAVRDGALAPYGSLARGRLPTSGRCPARPARPAHRVRRGVEAVVETVGRAARTRVRRGLVVQPAPPVVLVGGGLLPLLAHAHSVHRAGRTETGHPRNAPGTDTSAGARRASTPPTGRTTGRPPQPACGPVPKGSGHGAAVAPPWQKVRSDGA